MRVLPRLHDVYIGRAVLVTVLLTWAVLVGLDMLMALSGEVDDLGQGNYTFGHAVAYIAYTVPRRAYVLFPTAAVIGALMGLGQLAATSELTALRALGLSRRRLSLSVAITLAALTALMILNMETLAPWGQRQADALRTQAKSRDLAVAQYSGIWAREGNTFLNAQHGDEHDDGGRRRLRLRDVSLYELGEDGRLASVARATTAEHVEGSWVLTDVRRITFHANSATRERLPGERWESQLDPAALAASFARPRYQSARDLGSNIEYRERNQLDAREYEEVYWGRWFYPLNVLALCLAAIPFAFGTLRSGGLGKRLFLGILFALGFWLLQLLFGRLAGALKFDYRVAYALPPMVMLAVSWWLFRRKSG